MAIIKRPVKKRLPLRFLLAAMVLLLVFAAVLTFSTVFAKDKILSGVSVAGINIGRMTKDEALGLINNTIESAMGDKIIKVTYKDKSRGIDISGVSFDVQSAVENAFVVGRSGPLPRRILPYLGAKTYISLAPSFDDKTIKREISEFADEIEKENPAIEYSDDYKVARVDLVNGLIVDVEEVYNKIYSNSGLLIFDDIGAVAKSGGDDITADLLYSRIRREPVNAKYNVINNKPVINKHIVGVDVNYEDISEKLKSGLKVFEVETEVIPPEITAEKLEQSLFADVLGEFTTNYNSSNTGRTKNMAIAAGKINGTVIAPGEIFSFNTVVGERSYQRGYTDANVYIGGRIEQGVGGGICQVASTMYSAQLYADLQTVTRHNHMFTVSYLPLGQDATVAWNSVDYAFRNNTDYPIKITATVSGGLHTVRILGTKADKSKSIKLINTVISTKDAQEKIIYSDDLEPGKKVVTQTGQKGAVVDTYKVYYKNGVEERREFLHRSSYSPMDRIITASSVPSHQTTSEGEEKTERETQQQAEEEGEQENVPPPSQSPDKPPGQDIPDDLMSDNGL